MGNVGRCWIPKIPLKHEIAVTCEHPEDTQRSTARVLSCTYSSTPPANWGQAMRSPLRALTPSSWVVCGKTGG